MQPLKQLLHRNRISLLLGLILWCSERIATDYLDMNNILLTVGAQVILAALAVLLVIDFSRLNRNNI
ncbi:hypothetical protein ACQZV8_16635 [Magnetococcales bacterium HHB-1]